MTEQRLYGRGVAVLTPWMSSNRPFPYSSHVNKQKRNEDEVRVDNFIQITVICPAKSRVGAFVYRNTKKVYSSNIFTTILVFAKREGKK